MKKLVCLFLALLLLVPLGAIGEGSTESRYHGIYERIEAGGADLSWTDLKEVMGGGDTFHMFPDLGIKIYDPMDAVSKIDNHYTLDSGISKYFVRDGFELADESLQITFQDNEQTTGFIITRILNPDFEGCDVPLDQSRHGDKGYLYGESTFSVNGMPCACTWYMWNVRASFSYPGVVITSFVRVSENNVLLVRSSYGLGPGLNNKSLEEIESAAAYIWEKGLSFLSALCPLSEEDLAAYEQSQGDSTISGEMFKSAIFHTTPIAEGFSVGLPVGDTDLGTWEMKRDDDHDYPYSDLSLNGNGLGRLTCYIVDSDVFLEDPEKAMTFYEDLHVEENFNNVEKAFVNIDGHPAMLTTYVNSRNYPMGAVLYFRNNHAVQVVLTMGEIVPTMADVMDLANQITYVESLASLRQSQVELTVAAENNITSVPAGKSAKFTATFADTSIVNEKAKNNRVTWAVLDADGNVSTDAKIDSKGVLKASNKISDLTEVRVQATSETYGTSNSLAVTLLPPVKAVTIEPQSVSLFAVDGAEETVTVSLEPASVPLEGLAWTSSPKNVIEIEDHEDGTATIRPLKAVKATVTVKESGGKSGKFTVTVLQPVEALELSAKGKAIPGKSVTVNAKLTPNNATDKTLTWSLDVSEDIATISPKGQVKINKDTPVGTVITVTCTAEGAPEPIAETLGLEVVEK